MERQRVIDVALRRVARVAVQQRTPVRRGGLHGCGVGCDPSGFGERQLGHHRVGRLRQGRIHRRNAVEAHECHRRPGVLHVDAHHREDAQGLRDTPRTVVRLQARSEPRKAERREHPHGQQWQQGEACHGTDPLQQRDRLVEQCVPRQRRTEAERRPDDTDAEPHAGPRIAPRDAGGDRDECEDPGQHAGERRRVRGAEERRIPGVEVEARTRGHEVLPHTGVQPHFIHRPRQALVVLHAVVLEQERRTHDAGDDRRDHQWRQS